MSGRGILRRPALAIALAIGGLAGWLLGAHSLPARHSLPQSGAAAPTVSHRLPRMIAPSTFLPDWDDDTEPCGQDSAAEPGIMDLQWVTCYGAQPPESAAVGQGDPASLSMAVFRS
jgi:hypothetical protein